MNRLLFAVVFGLFTLLTAAQEKAEIIVSYDTSYPDWYDKMRNLDMTLLASPRGSKYFNEVSQWVDSLKSTPEGNAKYMDIVKKACMTVGPDGVMSVDLTKGPTKKTNTYIFTNPLDNTLTYYGKFGDETGSYTESLDELTWEIEGDSIANVLGYDCVMAEADYHGRHWKAWFAPDIPISAGPWKLHGLPGLILKAEAGNFTFTANGIEATDREITPMYMTKDYPKVDRKKAHATAEYYYNNMESMEQAKQGVLSYKVIHKDDDGNEIPAPVYDGRKHAIECDYK